MIDKDVAKLTKLVETLSKKLDVVAEGFDDMDKRFDDLEDKLSNISVESAPKKERKPRKPIDWSTKARGLIGKKYKGWKFEGDKLDVIATKGKLEVRASGMKSKEDFLEMLDEAE